MALSFVPLDEDERPDWITPTQWRYLAAVKEHGSTRAAERALGLSNYSIGKSLKTYERNAARRGLAPGHFINGVAAGYAMGKVTVQRNALGEVERTWERQSPEDSARQEAFAAMAEALTAPLVRMAPVDAPRHCDADLLTIYPQGDPHAGLYSWAEETGAHFDLAEYERVANAAVDRLVASTPPSAVALFNDKGDTTHADNSKNRTPQSGHALDVHGRHAEVVRVNLRVKRRQISRMLEKHGLVVVRIDPGNHDPETALMIALMLAAIYENEPRVEVVTSPNPYWYYAWGRNLIGTCHGDGAKGKDLPLLMATDQPELWGQTTFRLWLVGHVHHKDVKDYNGVTVEYVRTLAPADAWAHGAGYRSKRDMQAITLHRDFGEVERHTCNMQRIDRLAA